MFCFVTLVSRRSALLLRFRRPSVPSCCRASMEQSSAQCGDVDSIAADLQTDARDLQRAKSIYYTSWSSKTRLTLLLPSVKMVLSARQWKWPNDCACGLKKINFESKINRRQDVPVCRCSLHPSLYQSPLGRSFQAQYCIPPSPTINNRHVKMCLHGLMPLTCRSTV